MKRNIYILAAVVVFISYSFLPIFGESYIPVDATIKPVSCSLPIDFGKKIYQQSAESAIVIDAESRNILYSKNASIPRGMASTTKIMTALVAIENCSLDKEFVIPKEAIGIEGSSVYLVEGEPLTVRELLYCLMLESGNDAATAIAICCSGTVQKFVELMNERAKEIGLTNTHFSNPHGLSNEQHRTTAFELALITAEAMQYPVFCEIVSTKSYQVRYNGVENARLLTNHNKLLFGYEYATGVKTGYTALDGRCLVSSATRNGISLICVTLRDDTPTVTHKALLDLAFAEFENITLVSDGQITAEIPIEETENEFLKIRNTQNISLCLPKGTKIEYVLDIPKTVIAPINEGDIVGSVKCIANGKEVYIIHLESTQTVKAKEKNFWEKIFGD